MTMMIKSSILYIPLELLLEVLKHLDYRDILKCETVRFPCGASYYAFCLLTCRLYQLYFIGVPILQTSHQ